MGITIFAAGRIDCIGDIPRLIEDVKGFAEQNSWEYAIIDDDFDMEPDAVLTRHDSDEPGAIIKGSLGLKGIVLRFDAGAEPLSILFDRSGVLTDMIQQVCWLESKGGNERITICKTQFGSIDSHIRVIELLEILEKKYITNLIVNDEGAYWETRDRGVLAEKRTILEHYMRHTERVLGCVEIAGADAEDAEVVASQIEEALLKADKKREVLH